MTPAAAKMLADLFERAHMAYLETNPHHVNYETAGEHVADDAYQADEVVGEIEDGRTLYKVHVYPETPISSVVAIGHDIEAVLREVTMAAGLGESRP